MSFVLNLTASLFNKPQAIVLSKWGWLVVVTHATYLVASAAPAKRAVIKFRALFGGKQMLSYAIIALVSATLGVTYWALINKAYSQLALEGQRANMQTPPGALPKVGIAIMLQPQLGVGQRKSDITGLHFTFWNPNPNPVEDITEFFVTPTIKAVTLSEPLRTRITSGGNGADSIGIHITHLEASERCTVEIQFVKPQPFMTPETWTKNFGYDASHVRVQRVAIVAQDQTCEESGRADCNK